MALMAFALAVALFANYGNTGLGFFGGVFMLGLAYGMLTNR